MRKKVACVMLVIVFTLAGCSSKDSVSKEQYESVVAERDALKESIKELENSKESLPIETETHGATAQKSQKQVLTELAITESGWHVDDKNEFLYYGIIINNPNMSYAVEYPAYTITAKDESGKIIASTEQVCMALAPESSLAFGGFIDCKGIAPATVDFSITNDESDYIPSDENDPNSVKDLIVSNISDIPGDFGTSFTGEITNEGTNDFSSVAVTILLRNNGQIVCGEVGFFDNLTAGSTIPFDITGYSSIEYTDYSVYVQPW